MNILIASIILLYIVPFVYVYRNIQRDYSKGGKYEDLDIEGIDLFLTIMPFVNFVNALICFFENHRFFPDILKKIYNIKR